MDKKRAGDNLHFVFLKGLGDAIVEEIALVELRDAAGKCIQSTIYE